MKAILFIVLGVFTNIAFAQEAYQNPIDGKTYVADWKTYEPKGGVVEQKGRVVNAGVHLLSSQTDFENNVTAQELAKLIGYIKEVLTHNAEPFPENGEILLQITLNRQSKPEFKMSYQGDLKQECLQTFYDALSNVDLRTKRNTVALQIHYIIKNK